MSPFICSHSDDEAEERKSTCFPLNLSGLSTAFIGPMPPAALAMQRGSKSMLPVAMLSIARHEYCRTGRD
jgi:hypothetical protein